MERRRYSSPARAEAAERTHARIVEAALELFLAEDYEDVTMRRVAAAAGVSTQTVVNHSGTKEALAGEAVELFAAGASDARSRSVPDDVPAAMAFIGADNEQYGDVNWRLLTAAHRVPVIADALQQGRTGHRDWVLRTFPGAYAGLKGAARERRISLLMAATDAMTWKLLRRDHGLSAEDTLAAMHESVEALYRLTDPKEKS